MKSTLSLAIAGLSLVLSLFALAGVKSLSSTPAPAAPPAPAPDPALKAELSTLREELSTVKARLEEAGNKPVEVATALPALPAPPANPEREAMLAEMEKMWKARGEGKGGRGGFAIGGNGLETTGEGPEVDDSLAQTLDLQDAQVQALNAMLQTAYKEFVAIETQHTVREMRQVQVVSGPTPLSLEAPVMQLSSIRTGCQVAAP